MGTTLRQLAELVGGTVEGDPDVLIRGVANVREAHSGDITFISNGRYANLVATTRASAVVLAEGLDLNPCAVARLRVSNPDLAFARIVAHFAPEPLRYPPGVHPKAVIAEGAQLGQDVSIGACVVVQPGARIGDRTVILANTYVGHETSVGRDCLIYSGVNIRERVTIGDRVIIHSGTVIGSDGFGFSTVDGVHVKIPQVGTVEVEDDVEIGANVAIDRARFDKTHIGRGTKIDNLVQIAHNVWIGEGCLIVAQAGIAGSAHIGNHVVLAGQCGIGGHLEVGDGAVVAARAGVTKNVKPGETVAGFPAEPLERYRRQQVRLRKLADMRQRVRELEQRLARLEAASEDD